MFTPEVKPETKTKAALDSGEPPIYTATGMMDRPSPGDRPPPGPPPKLPPSGYSFAPDPPRNYLPYAVGIVGLLLGAYCAYETNSHLFEDNRILQGIDYVVFSVLGYLSLSSLTRRVTE